MNHLYDLTLSELGNLSLKVHVDEYSNFDILTRVRVSRWSVALEETRILPRVIRCLGKGRWILSTHASDCNSTQRADPCDVGELLSEKRVRIFKPNS
jgi:hypothetical protein